MIQTLVFIGAPILLAIWLAGLPELRKGRPKLAFLASGAGILLGLVCAFSGLAGPRHSNFWTGDAGNGDGFGLVGLFLLGGTVTGVSVILLAVTAVIAARRSDKATQGISE